MHGVVLDCSDSFLGIILHNLRTRDKLLKVPQAHKGKVSGLCFADSNRLLSCGVDRNIKLWAIGSGASDTVSPVFCFLCFVN